MIFIFDELTFNEHAAHIEGFASLYNESFPDPNERENIEAIFNRIKGLKDQRDPNTVLLLYPLENNLAAGQVIDWYKESQCIHLTYLVVAPNYRKKGIAKEILSSGLNIIIKEIQDRYSIQIRAAFFESNIPSKTVKDSFDPLLRLNIFSKLGAKWIDIPYTQPALDSEKEKVDNLLLLTFPIANSKTDGIEADVVIGFLANLYKCLSIEDPYDNSDFIHMVKCINEMKSDKNKILLKPIHVNY